MTTKNTASTSAQAEGSIQSLFKLADVALSAAESFATLNFDAAKHALSDGVKNTQAILAVKTPQDAAALQTSLSQPNPDTAKKYSEKVYEISSDSAKELAQVFQDQFEHMNKSFRELAEKSSLSFPKGSNDVMTPFNQVFEAANKAFENINQAVRQAAQAAEAAAAKKKSSAPK